MANIPFIVWKDEYEVGHPELDAHHQRLIKIINALYDAAMTGAAEEQVDETMKELDAYAGLHFRAEEEALEAVGYPHLSDQQSAHQAYARTLDGMKHSRFLPSGGLSQEILQFLKSWRLDHILKMDKEYGAFLKGEPRM